MSTTDVLASGETLNKGETDQIKAVTKLVETCKPADAFQSVKSLIEAGDRNHIELGGMLSAIEANNWFEEKGFSSFSEYLSKGIAEEFGFEERTARYLVSTYRSLSDNEIPWHVVSPLGWTKLRYLAPILTADNADDWAAKAAGWTVQQIIAAVKAAKVTGNLNTPPEPQGEPPKSVSFQLFPDQKERVDAAIDHAMKAANTESKAVALDAICLSYIEGAQPVKPVKDQIKDLGYEEALNMISSIWPNIDINVSVPE